MSCGYKGKHIFIYLNWFLRSCSHETPLISSLALLGFFYYISYLSTWYKYIDNNSMLTIILCAKWHMEDFIKVQMARNGAKEIFHGAREFFHGAEGLRFVPYVLFAFWIWWFQLWYWSLVALIFYFVVLYKIDFEKNSLPHCQKGITHIKINSVNWGLCFFSAHQCSIKLLIQAAQPVDSKFNDFLPWLRHKSGAEISSQLSIEKSSLIF